MGEILQLDYYYGIEAEQFSFYRVPRLLIKDERFKKLSSDAKLLYAVLVAGVAVSDNLHTALWSVAAYTVILCFSLFKTGSLSKSIWNAH